MFETNKKKTNEIFSRKSLKQFIMNKNTQWNCIENGLSFIGKFVKKFPTMNFELRLVLLLKLLYI